MTRNMLLGGLCATLIATAFGCGGDDGGGTEAEAGASSQGEGGSDQGGGSSQSASSESGGASVTGSSALGGAESSGGSSSGGSSSGGSSTGGSGGSSSGGSSSGGSSSGGSSSGGSGGGNTTTVAKTDKLDLLLVVDNSLSMGDKQAVLAAAVPLWLARLTNPDCVSDDGATRVGMSSGLPTDVCSTGLHREFTPLQDIHIGIVSNSLGDFGGDVCPETETESSADGYPDQNDHGWLLGSLSRVAAKGVVTETFLSWTSTDAAAYTTSISNKTTAFRNYVTATGELGCGFEMTLESWYRFLVDPAPPVDVTYDTVNRGYSYRSGTDTSILSQRAAFLRSDSLVAIVMLSDENDCSLKDSNAFSWYVSTMSSNANRMYRASSVCATEPNNACCYSCMLGGIDSSIAQECIDADPTCVYTAGEKLTASADPINLRCWQQKKRFGYDFLFPVTRYANALSKKTICPDQTYGDLDCDCTEATAKGIACEAGTAVDNPLYLDLSDETPTGADRDDSSMVFFAGIVGVPWQDLAADSVVTADPKGQDSSVALEYKTASNLDWDLFAPLDPYVTAPNDPLMIESVDARAGSHPITGEALAATGSGYRANSINGHEWSPLSYADLQFACIFSLEQQLSEDTTTAARECVLDTACPSTLDTEAMRECTRRFKSCACSSSFASGTSLNPICQQSDGTYGTTQLAAKAYPGVRELQALREYYNQTQTDNAIVASICPKDLTYANRTSKGYGYNPAFEALVNQLAEHLE